MYLQRNIEARSRNHCCRGKAVSIKYYVCVYYCVTYPARKSHLFCAALCFHLWPVWLYHFHIISLTAVFWKKVIEHDVCVLSLCATFV